MIKAIINSYKSLNNIKKTGVSILLIVSFISVLLGAKSTWFYFHDKTVIEKHDKKINQITKREIQKDEKNIQQLNNAIDNADTTLLDSVLPKQKTPSDTEQNSSEKLYAEIPHATAKRTELSGAKRNSELGLTNQLHPAPISIDEITRILQAEKEAGKEYCYPEEIYNDDGSTGFIEVCQPITLGKPEKNKI